MDTAAIATLTSPVVLFFVLGLLAALARSDLAIPEAMAKAMSLYLMVAIGLKGGVALAEAGIQRSAIMALGAGVVASFLLPFLAYAVLRWLGRLDGMNAGATAAHYGSVSVVTFVTAVEILSASGLEPGGYMVAVLAAMETPAILTGLFLAHRALRDNPAQPRTDTGALVHEVLFNASVVLLLGSFVIGMIAGTDGFAEVQPVFDTGFKGILCLFLLDMGLIAARRLLGSRAMTWRLALIAILLPVVNGVIGVLAGHAIGLDIGSVAAFGILCASASYIAVPAAMRLAVPQADPGVYLTMSLSITFPFNILINISLLAALARLLG